MTIAISILALVVAWFSFRESKKMRDLEAGRDQREDVRERQSQARMVAAWMCVWVTPGQDTKRWFLAVENASQVPVYDSVATVVSNYEPPPALAVAMVPPGRTYFELTRNKWGFGQQCEELGFFPRPLTHATSFRIESLAFTDAAGERWTRDETGRLTETAGPATELHAGAEARA